MLSKAVENLDAVTADEQLQLLRPMGDFASVLAWREALVTDHNCVDVPDIAVNGVLAAFQSSA